MTKETTPPVPIRHAAVQGTQTAYRVVGQGPALLLVHGAEGSHTMFAGLEPLLAPHLTLVLYDQRDCGDTEVEQPVDAGLQVLADDAAALLRHLGRTPAHVFGTSFGGRIAQVLALRHPEVVDRLVLGSTWPVARSLAELDPAGRARLTALRQGLPDTAEELAGLFIAPAHLEQQPHLKKLFANVQPGSARSQRRGKAVADQPALDIAGIRAKTLLMAGELDRVVQPAFTLGMSQAIQGSSQVLLPGVAHATSLQAPELVARQLLRFLVGVET